MITNRRTRQEVTLKVRGKETVRVPAGEFTAWRLEIEAEDAKQTAWIADTPARTLVRYDNDNGLSLRARKGAIAQRAIYHLGLVSCTIAAYRQGRL